MHFEFLDRFRGGNVHRLRDAAVGLEVGNRGAIHQNVGASPAAAVGNKIRTAAVGALVVHVGDTGREVSQVHYITVNEREIIDEPAVDHLASDRIFGVDALALGLHINTLRRSHNLQSEIRSRVLADVQFDVSTHSLLKPLHLCRHGVQSRRNRNKQIPAFVVRRGLKLISLLLVDKGDFRTLDDGRRRIGQEAAHSPEVALAE